MQIFPQGSEVDAVYSRKSCSGRNNRSNPLLPAGVILLGLGLLLLFLCIPAWAWAALAGVVLILSGWLLISLAVR